MARILLVEDDYVLANTLIDWLEFKGHQPDHSGNGNDALEKMTSDTYDVIVLDWNIPGLQGTEVCTRYRHEGGKTPVLMLTGHHGTDQEEECRKAGATKYLAKPFQLDDLTREVELLLAVDV